MKRKLSPLYRASFVVCRVSIVVFLLALCPLPCAFSQVPQGFNYQAVARDGVSGNPITDFIDVKIAILSDDEPETVIWEELHEDVDPDDHGLFSIVVGQGACQTAPTYFADIDWTVMPKYIRTQVDDGGGWKNMGSAQLWSVPYALHSNESDLWKVSGGNIYRETGNVGINTTSPEAALDVTGESRFRGSIVPDWVEMNNYGTGNRFSGIDFHGDDTYTDYSLRIYRSNTGPDAYSRIWHRGLGSLQILTNEAAPIDLLTAGSARLRVASDGKIGIGTTSPSYLLDVYGEIAARATNSFRLRQSTYSTILRNDNSAFYMLLTNSGDPDGTWNSLRPFSVNLTSGNVNIGNGALNVTHGGNIGVGTASTTTKMVLQPSGTWSDEVPLFEVKNKYGIPVFAVFNNGVKINIEHDPDGVKGPKGGFAIGGYDYTKGGTVTLMNITPDSVRFNINNENLKGPKGGFAIGGFDYTKGDINEDFLYITPQQSDAGQYNTFFGYLAGNSNQNGNYNTFIGTNAGTLNLSGNSNVFLGYDAGTKNESGGHNVSLGMMSLGQNTKGGFNVALGDLAGYGNIVGDGNIFLGREAGYSENGSDKLYIGVYNAIYGDLETNKIVINGKYNPNNRTFFVNGSAGGGTAWYNDSDQKLKRDIVTIPDALDKILKLRGVNFNWINPLEGMEGLQMGFIGQEAVEVIPEVVSVIEDHYSMQYAPITALLVEAVKEQQKQIEELKEIIRRMEEKIASSSR